LGITALAGPLDLTGTALVLSEFQNRRKAGFVAVRDEEAPWDRILDFMDYNQNLKGDFYRRMFYERKGQNRSHVPQWTHLAVEFAEQFDETK
jgi:hypothetical protein